MEMLVYVRNHGRPGTGRTHAGASVGAAPTIEGTEVGPPPTSFAEFRVDAEVKDPVAALRDALEHVFAVLGPRRHGHSVYFSRPQSAIRVQLEPGFDAPAEVAHELAEMLSMCSEPATGAAPRRPDVRASEAVFRDQRKHFEAEQERAVATR